MTVREYRYRFWTVREFSCCGYTWQIILSRRFPERASLTDDEFVTGVTVSCGVVYCLNYDPHALTDMCVEG